MHLFAVASGLADPHAVAGAVRAAAADFPALAGSPLECGASPDTRLQYAAIGHPEAVAAPRRYRAQRGSTVVLYDGLPIDRHGGFAAWDAMELLEHWEALPGALEGIFCAVRIDLAAGTLECLTDVIGMARVYLHDAPGRWVIGSSLDAVRRAAGLSAPDPLGVGSLFTLGWPIGGTTLVEGVRQLPGGHVHALGPRGLRSRAWFTPAMAAPRRQRGAAPEAGQVAHALAATVRSAGREVTPLTCGVTAGRDTRVLLALARAGGWEAGYYTSGEDTDTDVVVARELTRGLGLPHELVTPPLAQGRDAWTAATARFVGQTDGMVTLQGIDDWIDHQAPVDRLGLKLWGPGGEIGRAGNIGLAIPLVATAWGLRWSPSAQRFVLRHKARRWDLFRPEALEATRAALDRFIDARLEEGWRPREVLEAYYAFERVAHWAAGGVRRAASATDLFSPFVSRDFISWCFSLTSGERVVEAPHWRLLSVLAPDMRDMPFQYPWRPQRPAAAQGMVVRDVARAGLRRAHARIGRAPRAPSKRTPYGARWLAAGLDVHRELCLDHPSSPLWELVDRRGLEAALSRPRAEQDLDPRAWIWLCHALTGFWWFHGRQAAPAPTPEAAAFAQSMTS